MMENVLYRQPVESDLQAAFDISENSFSQPWSLSAIEQAFFKGENYTCIVAEYQNKLIGYIIAQTVLDEAEIVIVAVKEKFRNNKVAFNMMKEFEALLKEKNMTYCLLEVRVSNDSAIKLYRNLGFESKGIRKEFYTHPLEDAYIMTKELGC